MARFIADRSCERGGRMVREGPAQPAPPPKQPYPAEKARGGEIILNTPAKRGIFIAGLIGAVILALILSFLH
jgi:hypothetical protein